MTERPAPQLDALWALAVRELRETGRFPPPHRLRALLGVSEGRVRQLLAGLEGRGWVSRRSLGRGRAPEVSLTAAGVARAGLGVPIVGVIRGGPLGEAREALEGYLALPARPDRFALRVSGASMEPEIADGDLVILERHATPRRGEVCAVRVGEGDATLKALHVNRRARTARLEAFNPRFAPIVVPLEEVRVDGVMRALIRGDLAFVTGVTPV